jgi:DNA-binding HxlR family transcriptional regulator
VVPIVAIRQNEQMPRYVKPESSEPLEVAIQLFGSRVRIAICGYLQEHGSSARGEIAHALGISIQSTYRQLSALVDDGIVTADPPRQNAMRGQRVRYTPVPAKIESLWAELGRALRVGQVE